MSLIKEKTQVLHDLLEEQPFNQKMFRGELTTTERRAWLEAQLNIFEILDPHVREDLRRSELIREDIKALGGKSRYSLAAYEMVLRYAPRLEGHIYLNYMGLLYGGQIMSRHYPESARLYTFEDIKGAREYIRENFQYPYEEEEWYQEQVSEGFRLHIRTAKNLWRGYVEQIPGLNEES